MGATEKVYGNPIHPYTKMLIASVPLLHKKWRQVEQELSAIGPQVADSCTYHAMYPAVHEAGATAVGQPALAEVEEDHFVGCIRPYVSGSC
jgi:peptide/nickel transport system ATP-binding protein